MKRVKLLNKTEKCKKHTAVALGFFDGVHLGHRAVISEAVEYAKKDGLSSAVFTFSDSPERLLSGASKPFLTDNSKKTELIEEIGVDLLYMVPFEEVKELSCEEFVKSILYEKLKAKKVYCGFNYRFGKGGKGDINTLRTICAKYSISVSEIPPVMYEDEPISSTRIRSALMCGKIKQANDMLGRYFDINFRVISGNRLGRRLGFPTINQALPEDFIKPLYGVYASAYVCDDKIYPAVTNIGVRPTVGSEVPLAETWVIDAQLQRLYYRKAKIILLDFIRRERKFDSIDELRQAVIDNGKTAKEIFEKEDFSV